MRQPSLNENQALKTVGHERIAEDRLELRAMRCVIDPVLS